MHVTTIAERPDLAGSPGRMPTSWPEFMTQDQTSWMMTFLREQPEFQLVLLDDEEVVGYAYCVPFAWDGTEDGLPDTGWDEVLARGTTGHYRGREATAVSALEIAVHPDRLGEGLSAVLLKGMQENVRSRGFRDLFAPVRPSRKSDDPWATMTDYAARTREDGLPVDPWLRVHVRAGARIVKVCPASMVIAGSLAQWRAWTGMPFDTSGPVVVPGATGPVHVDVENDHAVYVEANVWMHHPLG
jgi:GNAT superfamily N-acetyltransferase